MVLELKVPHGVDLAALGVLWPVFLSYVLSFVNIGLYWNNHHHLLQACTRVSGRVLWANLHLLFWLSLVPFTTGWMGENHFAAVPVALYGATLLMSSIAYYILTRTLIRVNGLTSAIANAIGNDVKGKLSTGIYLVATPLALVSRWISLGLYVLVALMWLIPDTRIERSATPGTD